MRGARTVLVLGVVTLVAVGAVLFVERGSDTAEPGGETVFPALLEQLNGVTRVRVTGREGTFALARDGDAWVVEEKERYPADPDRVHKLLLGAAGMTQVEPKTSNPERYPKLWLEDPTGEDARSVRLVLEDASGAVLASWVLGDRRPSKSDASRTELYIRVADDPQAWLVEGSVPGGGKIIDWLDRAVARIDRERLRAAEVSHADDAVVAVNKELPADGDFVLRDIPEGRETDSQYRINDIGRFLEDLRFEDVAPASSLDFAGSADKRMEVTTFDGSARAPRLRDARRRRLGAVARRGRRRAGGGSGRSRCRRVRCRVRLGVGGPAGSAPPARRGPRGSRTAERAVAGLGLRASVIQAGLHRQAHGRADPGDRAVRRKHERERFLIPASRERRASVLRIHSCSAAPRHLVFPADRHPSGALDPPASATPDPLASRTPVAEHATPCRMRPTRGRVRTRCPARA